MTKIKATVTLYREVSKSCYDARDRLLAEHTSETPSACDIEMLPEVQSFQENGFAAARKDMDRKMSASGFRPVEKVDVQSFVHGGTSGPIHVLYQRNYEAGL